jgi:hypothetical protein
MGLTLASRCCAALVAFGALRVPGGPGRGRRRSPYLVAAYLAGIQEPIQALFLLSSRCCPTVTCPRGAVKE